MSVPRWIKDLQSRRDEITAELSAIDNNDSKLAPGAMPEAGGDAPIHTDAYIQRLYDELARINDLLANAKDQLLAEDGLDGEVGFIELEVRVD